MKRTLIYCISLLVPFFSFAQYNFYVDFESSNDIIEIDTTNPNNIWQMGQPQKTFLDGAYSGNNAIITGLNDPYPANNTSSFILKVPQILVGFYQGLSTGEIGIGFYSKYQTSSFGDFGTIEFSADSGNSWYNMDAYFEDTSFSYYHQNWGVTTDGYSGWTMSRDTFQEVSSGWEYHEISLRVCSVGHPKQGNTIIGCYPSSLWLKFVFTTDSIADTLDGWMIDDISIQDLQYVGIDNTNLAKQEYFLSPNPYKISMQLYLNHPNNEKMELLLFNTNGQTIHSSLIQPGTSQLSIPRLSEGIYFYQLWSAGVLRKMDKLIVFE